jgi:cytochrome c biogenesis protein CcdA
MKAKDLAMYILGAIIVLGFFGLLGMLIIKGIPQTNEQLLNIAIGTLLAAFGTVVGYFYGSSSGSKDKTELLNKKTNE